MSVCGKAEDGMHFVGEESQEELIRVYRHLPVYDLVEYGIQHPDHEDVAYPTAALLVEQILPSEHDFNFRNNHENILRKPTF